MKNFMAIVVVCLSTVTFALDYQQSLDHLKKYQDGFSDMEAVSHILSLAKSDEHPQIVTHAMALYTLHAGSVGETKICASAYKEALNRYPNAEAITYLKSLNLFPAPCSSCTGTGLVDQQQEKVCRACNRTGRCPKCGGSGNIADTGLRRPSSRSTSQVSFDTRCLTCGGSGRCGVRARAPVGRRWLRRPRRAVESPATGGSGDTLAGLAKASRSPWGEVAIVVRKTISCRSTRGVPSSPASRCP